MNLIGLGPDYIISEADDNYDKNHNRTYNGTKSHKSSENDEIYNVQPSFGNVNESSKLSDSKGNKTIHVMQIPDKYRSKNITVLNSKRKERLTSDRIYRKGMVVSAYIYNKLTQEIGDKLSESNTIQAAAEFYKIHPSMVSACAVYNKLNDLYGKDYADGHVRKVKKYITPGSVNYLHEDDKNAVAASTNTITFKYEYNNTFEA